MWHLEKEGQNSINISTWPIDIPFTSPWRPHNAK